MQISIYYLFGIFLLPTIASSFILFPKQQQQLSFPSNDHLLFRSVEKRHFKAVTSDADNEPAPGVVIRLTEKLTKLLTSERSKELLMKQFHGFTAPEFQFKALQMNVNIYETTLVKADSPEIDFKFQNPHSFSIKTSGGFAQFRGLYKGTYRTVRDGKVHIDLSGLNLFLQVLLSRSEEGSNKFVAKISKCEFSVNEIFVEMHRPLFPQAVESFKKIFVEYASKEMCQFVEKYAAKMTDKFQETLENSPISLKEFSTHKFDSSLIREPILDQSSLFFALNGKFAEKSGNERPRVEMFESDTDHMIYSYISDFVFNEFLQNFKNKKFDNIEKTPTLNNLLKFECDDEAECLGKYLGQDSIAADISIKFNEAPKVEFMEYGAKLLLNFNAELKTLTNSIISANFKLSTLVERFEIKADFDSITDDYKLKAKISIDDMEITDVISHLPEASKLAEALKANKDVIEEMIESNLHSLFPIETNSYLRVSSIKGFFRSRTLIFAFDLSSDGHLIRHLQLP